MADTPNMDLALPVVQETLGPTYAQMNNEAFETIDSHDHTDGKGVRVPTAGININLDLPMNGFAVTEVNALTLQDVGTAPDELSVFSDGGDLYYKNAAGNNVRITVGDDIAGAVGSISGLGDGGSAASFSEIAEDFSWFFNTGKYAAFNVGDIRLYPFNGVDTFNTFKITFKSPTTLNSDYSLTLPTALPANTNFVQVSSTGQLSFTNTLTQPILEATGSSSAPSYGFSASAGNGMYLETTNQLAFSTNGSRRLLLFNTGFETSVPMYTSDGTASLPGFSFATDGNTGIWKSASDEIGFATGGVNRMSLSTTGLTLNVGIGATTGTFSGAVSAATYGNAVASSLNLDGGGAFKIKIITVFSGTQTVSAGGTMTKDASHGLTLSSIRSISVSVFSDSGVLLHGNGYDNVYGQGVGVAATGSQIRVTVSNNTGASRTYDTIYAVVTYI